MRDKLIELGRRLGAPAVRDALLHAALPVTSRWRFLESDWLRDAYQKLARNYVYTDDTSGALQLELSSRQSRPGFTQVLLGEVPGQFDLTQPGCCNSAVRGQPGKTLGF